MIGGHGWVMPLPDGLRARCGGPAICGACSLELAAVEREEQATELELTEIRAIAIGKARAGERLS